MISFLKKKHSGFRDSRRFAAVLHRHRPAPKLLAPTGLEGHDPLLLPQMKAQHAEILAIFDSLHKATQRVELQSISKLLKHLHRALHKHLACENSGLYVFLDRCLVESHDRDALHMLRRAMNQTSKTTAEFIRTWLSTPPQIATRNHFSSALQDLVQAFELQFNAEEARLFRPYSAWAPIGSSTKTIIFT